MFAAGFFFSRCPDKPNGKEKVKVADVLALLQVS